MNSPEEKTLEIVRDLSEHRRKKSPRAKFCRQRLARVATEPQETFEALERLLEAPLNGAFKGDEFVIKDR